MENFLSTKKYTINKSCLIAHWTDKVNVNNWKYCALIDSCGGSFYGLLT
jgi:hypothetical protein